MRNNYIKEFTIQRPLVMVLILYALALFFRVLDIFVFNLDEVLGEIILSKTIGIIIILLFLFLLKKKISDIGLHSINFYKNMRYGLVLIIIAFVVAYSFEYLLLSIKDSNPSIIFIAKGNSIVSENAMYGSIIFGLWLVLGNFINSFMEEGLFRGVMIPVLNGRYSLMKANVIQSLLFGLWHILWPIQSVINGELDLKSGLIIGVGYVVITFLIGFTFGLMFIRTNSLWTSWFAHTFNNTVLNLVHIKTINGIDELQSLRVVIITLILFLLVLLSKKYISYNRLFTLKLTD